MALTHWRESSKRIATKRSKAKNRTSQSRSKINLTIVAEISSFMKYTSNLLNKSNDRRDFAAFTTRSRTSVLFTPFTSQPNTVNSEFTFLKILEQSFSKLRNTNPRNCSHWTIWMIADSILPCFSYFGIDRDRSSICVIRSRRYAKAFRFRIRK